MGKIRFTEERRLEDDNLVQVGDEMDFGEAENAAFVNNGVAEFVNGAAPSGQPAGDAAGEENIHG